MNEIVISVLASIAASGALVGVLVWLSKEWHKGSSTLQILRAVITAAEFAEFEATAFGKIRWLQRRFESKILMAARKLVSGEEFGADALEQAQIIQQKVVQLNLKTA